MEKSPNQQHKTAKGGLCGQDLPVLCGTKSTDYCKYEERAQPKPKQWNKTKKC
jgi:hypothetical protein